MFQKSENLPSTEQVQEDLCHVCTEQGESRAAAGREAGAAGQGAQVGPARLLRLPQRPQTRFSEQPSMPTSQPDQVRVGKGREADAREGQHRAEGQDQPETVEKDE